jgi:periplasmic copper chaperone A
MKTLSSSRLSTLLLPTLLHARLPVLLLALLTIAPWAWSHVTLEQSTATAGSSYRAAFRVGHGCDGLATTGITVQLPAGVQGAKPMPKPGWTLSVKREKLATPYTSHGLEITSDVSEIAWTATTKDAALPDAHYDEFILRAGLPGTAGALWFKVIQSCDAGNGKQLTKAWTQTPGEGHSTRGLATPAALLLVEPAAAKGVAPHH